MTSRTYEPFPPELGGERDFEYIVPSGRRLTEYEAVTVYTQPSVHGGGLQAPGDYLLRPDGRPVWDPASTRLVQDDWFAYRDPNRMWQKPYYAMQAGAERAIERATEVAIATGAVGSMEALWVDVGLHCAYLPFSHYEYGLFRALNMAARESLSDSINNVLIFNAADKLRHAQAISILGLDLETALEGVDGTRGRVQWLTQPTWQPVRRLVEEAMAILDWGEIIVGVNLALEPMIGEPLRRLVFGLIAASRRDTVTPVVSGTATADWHRSAAATREFVNFVLEGNVGNRQVLTDWYETWAAKARPVAAALFEALEEQFGDAGLAKEAALAADEETARAGADLLGIAAGA